MRDEGTRALGIVGLVVSTAVRKVCVQDIGGSGIHKWDQFIKEDDFSAEDCYHSDEAFCRGGVKKYNHPKNPFYLKILNICEKIKFDPKIVSLTGQYTAHSRSFG